MHGLELVLVWMVCVTVGTFAGYFLRSLLWQAGFRLIGSAVALVELVEAGFQRFVSGGVVHILDLMLLAKDDEGRMAVFKLSDLEPDAFRIYVPVVSDVTPLLNEDDAHALAGTPGNGSSTAMMLFENVWATRFADAIQAARGAVVLSERIARGDRGAGGRIGVVNAPNA